MKSTKTAKMFLTYPILIKFGIDIGTILKFTYAKLLTCERNSVIVTEIELLHSNDKKTVLPLNTYVYVTVKLFHSQV